MIWHRRQEMRGQESELKEEEKRKERKGRKRESSSVMKDTRKEREQEG